MATTESETSLVTPEDLAAYLAVSEAWIAEQARAGEIPAIKLGRYWRFRMSEIEAWLTTKASAAYKPSADA